MFRERDREMMIIYRSRYFPIYSFEVEISKQYKNYKLLFILYIYRYNNYYFKGAWFQLSRVQVFFFSI